MIGLLLILLVFAVFMLLRQQIAAVLPALSATIAFVLFLLPGAALSICFLPESLPERLPTAFILSTGLMIVPGVLVLILHLSLDVFVWIFSGLAGAAALVVVVIFARRSSGTVQVDHRRDTINPLLVIALCALAAGLCLTSLGVPMIGDDWAGMAFIQDWLVTDHLNLYEPFLGAGLPPTSRAEFGVSALDFALLCRLSGLNPIVQYHYLRPLMTLVALIAFYTLAREMLPRRNAAAFVTVFWMITLLASIVWGDPGYDLVARINQDKFTLRYILLPVALRFLLGYFQSHRLQDLIFFGLAGWAAGGTHPMGPLLIGLPCLAFGLIHLALERDRHTFGRLMVAALLLTTGVILPLIQLLGVEEGWLAFALDDPTDPNLLTRLRTAIRAQRLWLLPNSDYVLHPAAILDLLNLIAVLGLPFLVWRLRRSLPARLLLGTLVLIPPLLYFQPTGKLIGQLITPWLLYRLVWPVPLAAALTIGWCLWAGVEYPKALLTRAGAPSWARVGLPLAVLVVLAGVLAPSIRTGQAYLEDVRTDPNRAQCQEVAPLLEHLPEIIQSDSIVLADHDLNFCIPAYEARANVLEYRWTTTLSRFPPERRDEALQRVKDMLYYSSARFVDGELAAILDRHDVRYILIEEEEPLNVQLRRLPAWFAPIIKEGGYVLYGVAERRPQLSLVNANTAMMQGNWQTARTIYESALGQDPNSTTLAHLGLGELYLAQGLIGQAIEELEGAVAASPSDGLVWGQLADTLVAAGRYEEAVAAYERAVGLAPRSSLLRQRLGHVYRLTNQLDKGRTAYEQAIALLAPVGSARGYQMLGDLYAQAGWHTEALDAYGQSLAVLPGQMLVEISIGDVYLNSGDREQARAAYQRAARLDRWAYEPAICLGRLHEEEGDLAAAVERYRHAVQFDPTDPTGYALLAGAVQAQEGRVAAQQAIQDSPGYQLILPSPLLASGNLYAGQGHYDQAVAEFERAIARFPVDTASVKIALGSALLSAGREDAAIVAYSEAPIDNPSVAVGAYIGLGDVYVRQAHPGQAMGSYYKAVRTGPAFGTAHVVLGDGYASQAQADVAMAEYQRAVTVQPGYLGGYIALGDAYRDRGDWEQAIAVYRQAVAMYPSEGVGYQGLAQAYQMQGHLSEATQAYEDAVAASPGLPATHIALGQVYQTAGEIEAASAQYLQAVETDPTDLTAQMALGNFYLAQGDAEAAADVFHAVVEMVPTDARGYMGSANALLTLGSFDEALEQLQIAVQRSYWPGDAYVALGNEHSKRADGERAISAYRLAISTEPASVDGYVSLGRLYEGRGEWDAALAQYRAAVRAAPASEQTYTALGKALQARGDSAAALGVLYQAIEVKPTHSEAYEALGQVYRAAGRVDEALAVYEQAVQLLPGSAASWLALGEFKQSRGEWEEALTVYQQALAVEPGNVSAWISLGNWYQGQAQWQEAEECYKRAVELEPGNAAGYVAL